MHLPLLYGKIRTIADAHFEKKEPTGRNNVWNPKACRRTGKPYGVFGIGFGPFERKDNDAGVMALDADVEAQRDLLNQASFVCFRDSKSLACAREIGVRGEAVDFGCDGVFAYDIVNRKKPKRR